MIKIDNDALYKVKDLVEFAPVRTVLGLIKEKKIKAIKVGRHYLIKGKEITKYLENK